MRVAELLTVADPVVGEGGCAVPARENFQPFSWSVHGDRAETQRICPDARLQAKAFLGPAHLPHAVAADDGGQPLDVDALGGRQVPDARPDAPEQCVGGPPAAQIIVGRRGPRYRTEVRAVDRHGAPEVADRLLPVATGKDLEPLLVLAERLQCGRMLFRSR